MINWEREIKKVNDIAYMKVYGFEDANVLYFVNGSVTIPNSDNNNYFTRNNKSYHDRYEKILKEQNYHLRFSDGIFSFRIKLDEKKTLEKASYIFYPNSEFKEELYIYGDSELIEVEKDEKRSPIRIDFDKENADVNNHPIIHLTINECKENRMHLNKIITPLQFIHFIIYMYRMNIYGNIWKDEDSDQCSYISKYAPYICMDKLQETSVKRYKDPIFKKLDIK